MTYDRMRIAGVILAGGRSQRMFPQAAEALSSAISDKGLLPVAGRPMLAHVIARLAPQVDGLLLNANGDPSRFSALGIPVVSDTIEGYVGPLAGILTGLRWAEAQKPRADAIVTVSSDTPFIPPDLVERLRAGIGRATEKCAFARSSSGVHPVIGLWPLSLADDLAAAVDSGERKVLLWAQRHGSVQVEFDDDFIGEERVDPFFNANTPEELEVARRLLEKGKG